MNNLGEQIVEANHKLTKEFISEVKNVQNISIKQTKNDFLVRGILNKSPDSELAKTLDPYAKELVVIEVKKSDRKTTMVILILSRNKVYTGESVLIHVMSFAEVNSMQKMIDVFKQSQ